MIAQARAGAPAAACGDGQALERLAALKVAMQQLFENSITTWWALRALWCAILIDFRPLRPVCRWWGVLG